MDLLNQLVSLLSSPIGLVLSLTGLYLALEATQLRPRLRWFLLSLCGFVATLAKHQSEWVIEPPDLAFPLQQLRETGRPLTLALIMLVLINIFITRQTNWRQHIFPKPIFFLVAVQAVIVLKTLSSGSLNFAVLTIAIYSAIVAMMVLGPSRWLQDERNFVLSIWSIAMVGILFALANLYQATIDIYPITFVHGWFLGTTGNPHHAAVLIVVTLPCFLFLFSYETQRQWLRWVWLGCFALAMIGLLLTASRTGLVMAAAALVAFYWRQGGQLMRLGFAAAILLTLVFSLTDLTTADIAGVFANTTNKLETADNTRSVVFQGYWSSFLSYPIFGAPLTSDRLMFGESSWLGVAGSLGLAGLIPMILFGFSTILMLFRLNHITTIYPQSALLCRTVIAGLVALLLGGSTEAFLLGNLSFPVLALFLYLSMGNFLIEIADYRQRQHFLDPYPGHSYPEVSYPNIDSV